MAATPSPNQHVFWQSISFKNLLLFLLILLVALTILNLIVLGPMARRNLFGTRPAVGQKVRISGFSRSAVPTRDAPRSTTVASRRGASALASAVASTGAAQGQRALRTARGFTATSSSDQAMGRPSPLRHKDSWSL